MKKIFKLCSISLVATLSIIGSIHSEPIKDPLERHHRFSPKLDLLVNKTAVVDKGPVSMGRAILMNNYNPSEGQAIYSETVPGTPSSSNIPLNFSPDMIPGYFFNSKKESILYIEPSAIRDPKNNRSYWRAVATLDEQTVGETVIDDIDNLPIRPSLLNDHNLVKADFVADGTEQVLDIAAQSTLDSDAVPLVFRFFKAKDPDEPSDGIVEITPSVELLVSTSEGSLETMTEGSFKTKSTRNDRVYYGRPVVGDFDSDGNKEVVYVGYNQLNVFTVCAGDIEGTICKGRQPFDMVQRPSYSFQDRYDHKTASFDLAVGNFYGSGDDLFVAIAYQVRSSEKWEVKGVTYTFDNEMNATQKDYKEITSDLDILTAKKYEDGPTIEIGNAWGFEHTGGYVFAVTSPSSPYSTIDDVWLVAQNYAILVMDSDYRYLITPGQINVSRFTFDGSLNVSTKPTKSSDKVYKENKEDLKFMRGIAAGNFKEVSEQDDMWPKLIIYSDGWDSENEEKRVTYISPEKQSSGLSVGTSRYFDGANSFLEDQKFRPFRTLSEAKEGKTKTWRRSKNRLYSADLQGLSVTLGSPLHYRTESRDKPYIIVGAPPAHVDYTTPYSYSGIYNGKPDLLNLSFTRGMSGEAYKAGIYIENKETSTFIEQATTSLTNTVATQLTFEGGYNGLVAAADMKLSLGGSYTNQNLDSITSTSNSAITRKINESAGGHDKIGISTSYTDYYLYPVIGETVCTNGQETCSDSEKGQRYLQLTIPTEIEKLYTDGSVIPWYQPVHEPGSILSYPATIDQLEHDYGASIALLTPANVAFSTNQEEGSWTMIWNNATSDSDKTTLVNTGTWNLGFEASYGSSKKFEKLTGLSSKNTLNIDYDGSYSSNDTATSIQTFDQEMNVSIDRKANFKNPNQYSYNVTPVIYGDKVETGDLNGKLTPETVREAAERADPKSIAMGYLKLGYLVDLKGGWWNLKNDYRTYIDISLNNPTRWSSDVPYTAIDGNTDDTAINCVGGAKTGNCVIPYPVPQGGHTQYSSNFYNMRGFFITPLGSNETRYQATAGEKMKLTTRVYNYSLKDMPEGSKVHVRFYRQNYDEETMALVPQSAILIGESVVGRLMGADHMDENQRNWTTASVTWDTDKFAGQSFYFWVVAWAQDDKGNKISEMVGKGLEGSIGWTYEDIADVALEYNSNIITERNPEVPERKYSFTNNVGMYPQRFTVLPKNVNTTGMGILRTTDIEAPEENISLSDISYQLTEQGVDLFAQMDTTSQVDGLKLYLTTEDERGQNELIATRIIPRIQAFGALKERLNFSPKRCGVIPVTIHAGGFDEKAASAKINVNVPCN